MTLRYIEEMKLARKKIALGIGLVAILTLAYVVLWRTGSLAMLVDGEALQARVGRLGILGPFAVVGLIALAIVFTPVPSAPIALAAGALYGHLWGTLYVVGGAEIGALLAFFIARLVGYEVLQRWFGDQLSVGLLGSQNALTGIVFVSRLLPFISFDLVSYAAGLTSLTVWRFALATLAGIVPASFLLAHFGDEIASADATRMMISVLALGLITLVPVVIKALLVRRARRIEAGRAAAASDDLQRGRRDPPPE
jgi:uncharacterized membrane protein YdjX (TVP38/TMEM64 family)